MQNKILITIFCFLMTAQQAFAQAAAAGAVPTNAAATATTQAGVAEGTKTAGGLKGLLNSPATTIVLAGIATVYSMILYNAASKQEKESNENIKKIDKAIAAYQGSMANFCPKGRDDLSDPKCYCYTSDGKQNTNRTNSQTCVALWNKDTYKLAGDATDYSTGVYTADVAGCVTVTGQFDETCKCKKYIDSSGKNACQKESSISMPNGAFSTGLATSTGVTDLAQYAANAATGNGQLNSLDAASLANKAINAKKYRDAMFTKIASSDKNMKLPTIDEKNVDKYAKAILGEKTYQDAMNSSGGMPFNVASARSDNPAMTALLKQAQAKAGIEVSGGKGIDAKKPTKKNGFELNLGGDSSGSGNAPAMFAEAPAKNYKYKNSDISNNDSASIFEIISNRYVQSGLKRLFDDGEAIVEEKK